ncbi:hypothetical protein FHX44_117693 [Pseudonocardia hierapolitana]|uniref:Uncharacterized protein n=1 Tax=Pseudonocardia hierapolitana TaxID=1128676 RepID=A0A561T3R1_9PSEU|nr:hypothetical protein [Pseudonocardia hierapolitana]TWF81748.1 hypothetical protein FHX44_117693 [Pseudonocardia hierapolitana]
MWISLVVPVAILVATLLLQRLEAKLLRAPELYERHDHPAPLLTVGPLESPPPPPPRRGGTERPVARATA